MNLSKITGDWEKVFETDNITPQFLAGLHIGGAFNIPASGKFFIEPQLLFAEKGVKFEQNISGSETNNNILTTYDGYVKLREELAYLSIPVLIKYSINNFSVFAGLFYSFLLEARVEGEEVISYKETNLNTNLTTYNKKSIYQSHEGTDGFKASDMGLIGGIEYIFPINLGYEARIENGLEKIFENSSISSKFSNFTIHTGLKYIVNRK